MAQLDSEFLADFAQADGTNNSKSAILDVEGDYRVAIESVSIHNAKNNRAKQWLTVNFEVLESSSPLVPVKSRRAWLVNLLDEYKYGPKNAKSYVCAISGYEPGSEEATLLGYERNPAHSEKEHNEAFAKYLGGLWEDIAGEAQVHTGCTAKLRVKAVTSTKTGKPLSMRDWFIDPEGPQFKDPDA